jgi:hypothetical protein
MYLFHEAPSATSPGEQERRCVCLLPEPRGTNTPLTESSGTDTTATATITQTAVMCQPSLHGWLPVAGTEATPIQRTRTLSPGGSAGGPKLSMLLTDVSPTETLI